MAENKGINSLNDEINLAELIDKVKAGKRKIFLFAIGFTFLAVLFLMFAAPAYRATATVKVEPGTSGEASGITSEGELQVITSMMVIDEAISLGKLDVVITPAKGVDETSLDLKEFSVPEHKEQEEFTIVSTGEGGFELKDEKGNSLLRGDAGKKLSLKIPATENYKAGEIVVHIAKITADKGSEFEIIKQNHNEIRARIIKNIEAELIGPRGKGGVIRVTYFDTRREKARLILDSVIKSYIKNALDRDSRGKLKSLEFIKAQLEDTSEKLAKAEDKLKLFQQENNTVNLTIESDLALRQAVEIETKISEIRVKQKDLSKIYTSEHPVQVALENQATLLSEQLEELNGKIRSLPEIQRYFVELNRDVESLNRVYSSNVDKLNELEINESAIEPYARVINEVVASSGVGTIGKIAIILGNFIIGALIGALYIIITSSNAFSRIAGARE